MSDEDADTERKARLYDPVADSFAEQALLGAKFLFGANRSLFTVLLYNCVFLAVISVLDCTIDDVCLMLLTMCVQFMCESFVSCLMTYVIAEDRHDIAAILAAICLTIHALSTLIAAIILGKLVIRKP